MSYLTHMLQLGIARAFEYCQRACHKLLHLIILIIMWSRCEFRLIKMSSPYVFLNACFLCRLVFTMRTAKRFLSSMGPHVDLQLRFLRQALPTNMACSGCHILYLSSRSLQLFTSNVALLPCGNLSPTQKIYRIVRCCSIQFQYKVWEKTSYSQGPDPN